jgi:molybdopterin synthase catalytic subunit
VHVEIRDDAVSVDDVTSRVEHAGAGAIDVFVGRVRDENDGRPVVLLEYEAYKPMALAEMQRIGEEIEMWPSCVRRVHLIALKPSRRAVL